MIISGRRNTGDGNGPLTVSPTAVNKAPRRRTWTVSTVTSLAAACLLIGIVTLIKGHSHTPAPQPPFIVGLHTTPNRADLTVVSTATGEPLTRVQPPKGMYFRDTAATSDGRTFIIAAESASNSCDTWLYKLRLTAQGAVSTLTPYKIPKLSGLILSSNDLSVSADGRRIAYSASLCTDKESGVIAVANAATGQVRTSPLNSQSAWSVSSSSDGRVIGFVNTVVYGGDGSIRLLRADAAGRLTAVRIPVVMPSGYSVDVNGSIAMSPDGATLLTCAEGQKTAVLAAYNARTGKLLRVVHTWPNVTAAPCDLAYSSSGQYVLVYDIDTAGTITKINVSTGQVITFAKPKKYPAVLGVSW